MIIFWGKKSLFGGILVTFEGPLSLYVGLCIVHSIKSTKKILAGSELLPPSLGNASISTSIVTATLPLLQTVNILINTFFCPQWKIFPSNDKLLIFISSNWIPTIHQGLSCFHMSPQRDSSRWQIAIILKWFVSLHMYPQRTSVRGCKFTLVAFVWLFSTVYFQMCPQIALLRRGIVALVAFIWFFPTLHFQMCPQSACIRWCKVTLVAFVWLLSTVHFQICPQSACITWCKVTLVAFVWLLSTVVLNIPDISHHHRHRRWWKIF